ncbi:STAS domain-containing protein [Streptomyces sp. NPDC059352]|uniref:STAS domain-containing protein n=1 Tax=Streptomyces sp. NPDC059352 TaxID=3346810 RepID=UPI00367D1A06
MTSAAAAVAPARTRRHGAALSVHVTSGRSGTRVQVEGEIDLDTATDLGQVLVEAVDATDGSVAVDLSRVVFCDCSGLNALLRARRHALARCRRLAVVGTSRQVRRLLAVTGADALLIEEPGA